MAAFRLFGVCTTLVALAILSTMATGCRLGNHTSTTPNPDTLSGYYATQPQALDFFVTAAGQTTSASVSPTLVPARVSGILTNPVALKLTDLASGSAILFTPIQPVDSFPISFQTDNATFGVSGSYPSQTLWTDPACTVQEYIEVLGRTQPLGSTPAVTSWQGISFQITGRLDVDVWIEERIDGSCVTSLQQMYDCYENLNDCAGSSPAAQSNNQAWVQSLFNGSIQAGIMTAQDIKTVGNIAYQASYR
jgi:hypothetical protein